MAIPQKALVENPDTFKQVISQRLYTGKEYWRPLHAKQDRWMGMYKLLDVVQQLKPVNHRRFISNEPHTAVDLAMSILTRNDAFWRIAMFESASQNADERRLIGKIERTLQGIVYDIDDMFSQRLRMRMWKQAAYQALLRGFIWGKCQITTEALKYRDTPIFAEMYDPRMVIPHVDAFGLAYVLIESETTLGDLVNMYPDTFGARETQTGYNPNARATKIEYWSNDRGEKKGVNAVLACEAPVEGAYLFNDSTSVGASQFVIPPYYHGYSPAALPVVGVPVNGLDLIAQPQMSEFVVERMQRRADLLGTYSESNWFLGQNAHVADKGRSILAAVEEHVPQYNELIATVLHHLSISAYGTWTFTSPTGELPRWKPGIEAQIPLTPEERVDRIEIGPINADAFRLVEILGDEKQNGMLANVLRANTPFQGTGVVFQQMNNVAMNALEPYQDGMEEFGQRLGASILAQMQMAAPALKSFELMAPRTASSTKRQSYWVVEFDPKKDLAGKKKFRPRPVFKPALPDDLAVRINAARLALDPRRPILSLTTVLEHILQVEDPSDEIDRIWEDIANTDPVLVFEQIGMALERLGEKELAERIQEKQFRTAFIEELAFKQQSGANIPVPQINGETGQIDGLGGQVPNMPPQTGGGEFNTQTRENLGGGEPAGAAGGGIGTMGERATV